MTKRLRVLIGLVALLVSASPAAVFAAKSTPTPTPPITNQSFQVSPPTSNYPANPGTTVHGSIKVTNLTGNTLTLQVGKENFVAKGEEGEIELIDEADPIYSLAPWFNLGTTQQFTLGPTATKSFDYTIAVPLNAEPGGRYGTITFTTIASKLPNGQSGAAVRQEIAPIVFLRINGEAKENLGVASFNTGKVVKAGVFQNKNFFEYAPVDFMTRVKNDGTVHEKPTGTITIKNIFGLKVTTIPLDEHYVIPGAIRRLHNSWPTGGKKPFLFGRYTAHLDATYASGQKLTAETSFTVIPYKLVIIVLIILLILFMFFFRGRKRFARAARILAGKE
jgi:hypothetical protein